MRRLFSFAVLVMSFWSWTAFAGAPVAGTDYEALSPPRPTSNPSKIVVTEFFSYQCPHCYQFSPLLNAWVSKLPSDVVFERIPVTFGRPDWGSIAQAYYSLQAMNKLDAKMDAAIFDAIHMQHIRLGDFSSITDWIVKQGINGNDFRDMYTSFSIQSSMRTAEQAAPAYRVDGVPTLVIDGRYKVLGPDHNAQLATADALISMVRAARGMPEPAKVVNTPAPASSSATSKAATKVSTKSAKVTKTANTK
jgi:thiol:disulfide interchange protein DsbA